MSEICPACDKPTETLVAGVCPRCKSSFKAAHKSVEVKWSPEDFAFHVKRQHAEAVTEADDHEEPEIVELAQQESGEEDRKAADVLRRMKIGLAVCAGYSGNARLAVHCLALAMGFRDIAQSGDDSALAKAFGVSKQAVTKCKLIFQERMDLPPTEGQRDEKARENMRKARINQLKP